MSQVKETDKQAGSSLFLLLSNSKEVLHKVYRLQRKLKLGVHIALVGYYAVGSVLLASSSVLGLAL